MITVPGRVLSSLVVKDNGTATETPRNGSWNMRAVKFTSSATVPAWAYLWVKRAGRHGLVEKNKLVKTIVTSFRDKMRDCGLAVPEPIEPGPSMEQDAAGAIQINDQLIESI
jgi:predicted FMN-binding regulatory protein PaiB